MTYLIHKEQNVQFANLGILILLRNVFMMKIYHQQIRLFKLIKFLIKL